MPDERVYKDTEVARIIERAMEHQHSSGQPETEPGVGLTLSELEGLGAEVGIRPELLRLAAAEIDVAAAPSIQRVSGGLYEMHTERWVPGRLSEAEVEDVFARIKHRLGASVAWNRRGEEVGRLGRTQWISMDLKGATRIAVTEQDDGYVLRVTRGLLASKPSDSVILGLCLATFLSILPVGAAVEWLDVWWAVLAAVLTMAFSIAMVHRWNVRTRMQTEQTVQEIADIAARMLQSAAADPAGAPHHDTSPAGRVDPDLIPLDVAEEPVESQHVARARAQRRTTS